jgi:hypothetical protein
VLRRFLASNSELSLEELQKLFPGYTPEQIAGLNDRSKKRDLSLEQIQRLFPKYTLEEIADAQEPIIMQSFTEGAVNDTNGYQDDDDHTAPSGYSIKAASNDPANALRSTASEWSKRAIIGYRWPNDERNVLAYQPRHNKRVFGSPFVDLVERQDAVQDEKLLKRLGRQKFTELKMARRLTANTGDWDNDEWRSYERRRFPDEGPSRNTAADAVLNEHRGNGITGLVTEATTLSRGTEYGPANAVRRNVSGTRQWAG